MGLPNGHGRAFARFAFLVLGFCLLAGGSGCGIFGGGKPAPAGGGGSGGGGGDGREIKLVLSTEAKLNTCGDGPANALGVRIYQLGGDRGIAGAPQAALWEDDQKELGPELLDKQEYFLDPGTHQTVKLRLDRQAHFLAVVGNFCKSDGACWKWLRPTDGLPSETELRFGETCTEEKRPK